MRRLPSAAFLAAVTLPLTAHAATWSIQPDGLGDAPTIQAGVDSAASGDTLLLAPGTYAGVGNHDVLFDSKDVSLLASARGGEAILDCQGAHVGLDYFDAGGRVRGIAILNASFHAVRTLGGTPVFESCRFEGSTGNVLRMVGNSVQFLDCAVRNNPGVEPFHLLAGGFYARGCVFSGNGPELIYASEAGAEIVECTIVGNEAPIGVSTQSGLLSMHHSIVAFNNGGAVAFACPQPSGTLSLGCMDVYGNEGGSFQGCATGKCGINGNFSLDPHFCDLDGDDLTLAANSPCLSGQHPYGYGCGTIGAFGLGCAAVPGGEPGAPCGAVATVPLTWGAMKGSFAR